MAISTNQKPTIYRNMYENMNPDYQFTAVTWVSVDIMLW